MVTHLRTRLVFSCLISVIFPFTLIAFIAGSCLRCAVIEAFKLGILLSLCAKKFKFTTHPSLYWLTNGQYKHNPKVKAVRMNRQITEVKQLKILGWVTITFCLFSVAEILGKFASWKFGKTQMLHESLRVPYVLLVPIYTVTKIFPRRLINSLYN